MIDFLIMLWRATSATDFFILTWLLPSLVMFLMMDMFIRYVDDEGNTEEVGRPMERWDAFHWKLALWCSVVYPLGIGAIFLVTGATTWVLFHTFFIKGNEKQWKRLLMADIKSIKKT